VNKHEIAAEGVRDAWDFWLSQHPVSVPEIIAEAVGRAFTAWLEADDGGAVGRAFAAWLEEDGFRSLDLEFEAWMKEHADEVMSRALGTWLDRNGSELMDRVAREVARAWPHRRP
jgi:hypothetical protein